MPDTSQRAQRVIGRFVVTLLAIAAVLLGATYYIETQIYRYFCFGMSFSSLLVAISVFTMTKFRALSQRPCPGSAC